MIYVVCPACGTANNYSDMGYCWKCNASLDKPKIIPGTRYTKNGVSVDIHSVKDGWVYCQRWPRDVDEQEVLKNLIRMPVDDFLLDVAGAEITTLAQTPKPCAAEHPGHSPSESLPSPAE